MVQRKDPRRSVFSRGDKTNGSVSSGGRNPDGPKSCSFVSARAKLSLDYSVCYTNNAIARKISYGKKQLLDACRTSNGNTEQTIEIKLFWNEFSFSLFLSVSFQLRAKVFQMYFSGCAVKKIRLREIVRRILKIRLFCDYLYPWSVRQQFFDMKII